MSTTIQEPQVLHAVPFDEYRQMHGVNSSLLKSVMLDGAAQAIKGKEKDTQAMRDGRAVHIAALEPEKYSEQYARFDDTELLGSCVTDDGKEAKNPRATKQYKAAVTQFQLENMGKEILPAIDYDILQYCGTLAQRHIPDDTYKELTITWARPSLVHPTEIACKARLDAVDFANRTIYDIKTTGDTSRILIDMFNLKYHTQMTWYLEAVQLIYPGDWKAVVVVVQTDGTDSVPITMDELAISMGERENNNAIRDWELTLNGMIPGSRWDNLPKDFKAKPPAWYKPYGTY